MTTRTSEVLRSVMHHGMYRRFEKIANCTTFLRRLIFSVWRAVLNSRFALHASGKSRRFLLIHFRNEYVQQQLSNRQGACRQCGICCNLLFTCPMLTKQGRCLAYGTCRPQVCKVFPIDQSDLNEVKLCGGQCGYLFNREDLKE